MGELGFFGCCFPESMGGTDAGYGALATVAQQLAWVYPPLSAAMNLQAATVPLTIANWGTPDLASAMFPNMIAGRVLGCNAMTEPDGGSDFLGGCGPAGARRRRVGDHRGEDVDHERERGGRGIVYAKTARPGAPGRVRVRRRDVVARLRHPAGAVPVLGS